MEMKRYFSFYNLLLLLFIAFIALPVLYTLISAFFANPYLSNDLSQLDFSTFTLLSKSILLAAIIAILTVLIGTGLAFMVYKTQLPLRRFLRIILLIPLFISPYILAAAWNGFFFFIFENVGFRSSYFGLVLVLTTVYTPLAMLIVGGALANISAQIEESALMMTNTKTMILRIILPLIKPALLSSFVLVFIFSISNFAVPAFFGVKVFTTEIFTQFSAFYKHSFAIIQSVFLILICVALLLSEYKYLADAPFLSFGNRGLSTKLYSNNRLINWSLLLVLLWIVISIVLPFFILIIQSFDDGIGKFQEAFNLLLPTFADSIFLAFIASVFIVLIGFTVAYYQVWQKQNVRFFNALMLLIFVIPSTVFGISLIKFYNHPELNWIYSTYAIIIIAFVGKFSFIAAKLLTNALRQIPKSLNDAAQIAGLKSSQIVLKILLPLALPTLFASFIISFIFSLGELGTTIMVYPPGTELMPIKVFTIMANAPQSLTSSMNLIVFSITLILISVFSFIAKQFFNKANYVNY
jgi:ABC-type Fe3+ transport system permease subunit